MAQSTSTGRGELTDRDPWSGGDQCEDLSFLFRRNLIDMNPEILEELEILDDERMDLSIGPYPVEQPMRLRCVDPRRTTPAAGWFVLITALAWSLSAYLELSQASTLQSPLMIADLN